MIDKIKVGQVYLLCDVYVKIMKHTIDGFVYGIDINNLTRWQHINKEGYGCWNAQYFRSVACPMIHSNDIWAKLCT